MIRVAVIGTGALGSRHAQAYAALGEDCTLVGVHDDSRVDEMLAEAEVAVVAGDQGLRFHHTALALEHGLDVLVEQPVAPTPENARMLARIASLRTSHTVVQASQPDQFNPALERLTELAAERDLLAIDIRRQVDPSDGETIESHMLRDVGTLTSLARSPLVRLQASGRSEHTVATLAFESGLIGTLAAGTLGGGPACEVTAATTDASIVADLPAATVELRRGTSRERTQLPVCDPYLAQAESFLRAVRARSRPEPSLRTAVACLEVVSTIRECLAVQAAATGSDGVRT